MPRGRPRQDRGQGGRRPPHDDAHGAEGPCERERRIGAEERVVPEGDDAVRAGVGVHQSGAEEEHEERHEQAPRQQPAGEVQGAELRPDDVHDPAAFVLEPEQVHAELGAVDLELAHLPRRGFEPDRRAAEDLFRARRGRVIERAERAARRLALPAALLAAAWITRSSRS